MKTADAVYHFKTKAKLAKALGVAPPSIYSWGDHPPPLRQIQIQRLTNGDLVAELDVFETKRKEAADMSANVAQVTASVSPHE
jgi:hypothetical protein